MEFHEFAACFPLIAGEELEELSEDIRTNGLNNPIVLFQGKVLDGRNRSTACVMAGVEPKTREFEGTEEDALRFVMSENLHRRHLTQSDKAIAGEKMKSLFVKIAKRRMQLAGKRGRDKQLPGGVECLPPPRDVTAKARDEAGKAVGVSGRMIDHVAYVRANGAPELIEAMDSRKVAVSRAALVARQPKNVQLEEARRAQEGLPPIVTDRSNRKDRARRTAAADETENSPRRKTLTEKRLEKLIGLVEEMKTNADKPSLQVSILDIRKGLNEVLSILKSLN